MGRDDMLSLVLPLLLAAVALAVWLWGQLRRPPGFPPGPTWLPLVGNYQDMCRLSKKLGSQHEAFTYLAQKYGSPVIGLHLGGELTVIVSTRSLIREVLTRPEFEGRPQNFFARLRSLGLGKGVTMVAGKLWQEQRAFVMRHLRSLGFSGAAMQALVGEEVRALLEELSDSRERPTQLKQLLVPSVLNVIFHFCAGYRFPRGDQLVQTLMDLQDVRSRAFDMTGGKLSAMPWLRFIQPEATGYNAITKFNKITSAFCMKLIEDHKATYVPGKKRDLIDAYLCEIAKAEEAQNNNRTFMEDQLLSVLYDMTVAGLEETSSALQFAFLMMLRHPDVQGRVHNEIKEAVGTDRFPTLEDKDRLVYTMAALMESMRMCYVLPIRGFRRLLEDTTLHGYRLPVNTTVLVNNWSLQMDKEHWGDPEVYRPERFISETGLLREDDIFLPFGLGRRRCLGEQFSKSFLFQIFAGVLQKFQLVPADGTDLKPTAFEGFNLAPKTYDIIFKSR
ncbi:methyl farnesoate epoxidase-like isoform X2 [Schistocerca cancellata]|uniref:methyl farnesoate epoxidase-like isoform X2 n=1 Tax=Schistocerca cancellata TaxID=274614 RepID=UPI00211811C6|nr:methyl farnesoate epoxidase-like isoform X2 [Schistocerca cancellata]